MRTAHALTVSSSMCAGGGCTWSRGVPGPGVVYLVWRGVPGPGGYLVPGGVPGLGGVPGPREGVPGPRGVYLVPGGVPGPRGVYLVPGGCTWSRGCTWSQGGVPGLGGCTWSWGGVLGPRGVPGPGGCTWSWGGVPAQYSPPPVNRMTNRCKNITLPQTSFADGNNNIYVVLMVLVSIHTHRLRLCIRGSNVFQ